MITMGGADRGNATLRVMVGLGRLRDDGLECAAILGPANPHVVVDLTIERTHTALDETLGAEG